MKKNLAIVGGGYSSESVISIKSAAQVFAQIDRNFYEPFLVEIGVDKWVCKHNGGSYELDKNDFSITVNNEKITFDVVFNAIHGTPGEDGILQSYFQLLNIPHTSCNPFVSSLTFNKFATKAFLKEFGVITAPSVLLNRSGELELNNIAKKVGFPCFVKPNNAGSSFGISKVKEFDQLKGAIEKAFEEDSQVIIESFVKGREFTCGVFFNGTELSALPVTEVISLNEFFDYEAKYTPGKSNEVTPAEIEKQLSDKIQNISKEIYSALSCSGVVRVDFIFDGETLNLLEINTVPGLSPESIVPQQAKAAGYTLTEFYHLLIDQTIKNQQ